MHNIEKLTGHSHYTGYGAGCVWRITRSTSSFGTWRAKAFGPPNKADRAPTLYAFRLRDLSAQLDTLAPIRA